MGIADRGRKGCGGGNEVPGQQLMLGRGESESL